MKSSIGMFGIKIDIVVPNKPKKKRRKRAKALSAPRKDKMMRSPKDGEGIVAK